MKADAKGHWAEFLARLLFRLKGYRIVAVNYVTGRGTNAVEVDFVACRQNVIVFVEVKHIFLHRLLKSYNFKLLRYFVVHIIIHPPGAVSYTHLDVYKRQIRDLFYSPIKL